MEFFKNFNVIDWCKICDGRLIMYQLATTDKKKNANVNESKQIESNKNIQINSDLHIRHRSAIMLHLTIQIDNNAPHDIKCATHLKSYHITKQHWYKLEISHTDQRRQTNLMDGRTILEFWSCQKIISISNSNCPGGQCWTLPKIIFVIIQI